jgi:hypothetical protein
MAYYYWDDRFKTDEGFSLKECLEQFGTKLVSCEANGRRFKYKVILLDGKKSLGNSWMLWMKDGRGKNVQVGLYEKDATRVAGVL